MRVFGCWPGTTHHKFSGLVCVYLVLEQSLLLPEVDPTNLQSASGTSGFEKKHVFKDF